MNSDKSSFISDLLFKGILLENTTIEVLDISSCIADTSRIKYMAKIQRNLEDILPVLFLSTSNSKLTKKPLILSFTVQQHNFMLGQNGDLAVTYVKDEEEIDYINFKIIELINKGIKFSLSNRLKLEGLVEKKKKLTPMTVYDLFPKTNCRECGEDSCFNYAAKIMVGKAGYSMCPYLGGATIKSVVTPIDLKWRIEFGR